MCLYLSGDLQGPCAIVATLHGHKDRVNFVRWIRQPDGGMLSFLQVFEVSNYL